jgi:outer membrane protein assembly factor BamB
MRWLLVVAVFAACVGCKNKTAPAGPPVVWRVSIDKDTYDAVATASGLVIIGKPGVSLLRDGKVEWTRALEADASAWLVAIGDSVLAGDDAGTVYGIALADGAVMWKATTPATEGGESPWVKDAAAHGERVVLLDAYMRFLVLDPAACAASTTSCMTTSGELTSGASAEELELTSDGTRVAVAFTWLALFSATGDRVASFSADDLLGGVTITGTTITVAHDQGVARIDPARCKVEGGKFRLGKREDRDDAPPGCIEKLHVGPIEAYNPAASASATVWVAEGNELQGRGARSWKIGLETLHAASSPVAANDIAYVPCWEQPKGDKMFVTVAHLCAVALDTGTLRWRSSLGLDRASFLAQPWVVVGGGMIYVLLGDQVAALRA